MMYKKIIFKSVFLTLILSCSTNMSRAQNVQNFVNNEENRIQQDANAGFINSKQATALQNRQAQIMYQEQQDKNLNGGNLTQQEQRQIAAEERGLSRGVNGAVYQNNPNALMNNNNWQNRQYPAWNQNSNNYQSGQSWHNLFNQNQNNVNNPANQSNQTNQFNGFGGQPHRHHWQQWGNN